VCWCGEWWEGVREGRFSYKGGVGWWGIEGRLWWMMRWEGFKHVHGPQFRTQLRMRYLVENWKTQLPFCLASSEVFGICNLCKMTNSFASSSFPCMPSFFSGPSHFSLFLSYHSFSKRNYFMDSHHLLYIYVHSFWSIFFWQITEFS